MGGICPLLLDLGADNEQGGALPDIYNAGNAMHRDGIYENSLNHDRRNLGSRRPCTHIKHTIHTSQHVNAAFACKDWATKKRW